MEIISHKEAVQRGLKFYFSGKPCKNGHVDKRRIDQRLCVQCIKENREHINTLSKVWREKNPKRAREIGKKWDQKNPEICAARVAKRKAAKLKSLPNWLDVTQKAEIDTTYLYCSALRSCGLDYHVDHIVPIQGKTVSGLHVPWNLQVIPARENIVKSNSF